MSSQLRSSTATTLVKAFFLTFWLCALVWLAITAYTGKARAALDLLSSESKQPLVKRELVVSGPLSEDSPLQFLYQHYHLLNYSMQLETFVDALNAVVPEWQQADKMGLTPEHQQEAYWLLFVSVKSQLATQAKAKFANVKQVRFDPDVLPQPFKAHAAETKKELPQSVQLWLLKAKRDYVQQSNQVDLFGAFLILVVIGALGSILLLTRDLLIPSRNSEVVAYVFKPLFGVSLAIIAFIISVSLHVVLSTAPVSTLRPEGLYFIGLMAALFTESIFKRTLKY